LTSAVDQPSPTSIARLEHAYDLRSELDPSWAARPLELIHDQGKPALLIEDHGGEVLARLLGKPWELDLFLRVAIGITAALGRLHQRGLFHRDIKPANIFVNTSTGEGWLSGFGLASRLPRDRQTPEPPETIAGTLAYMAPEQTGRMNRSIDSRSDLYSLGVTLYQLLTGSLPFTASDPMEWVHCHIARRPVPPSERLDNIPIAVSQIIMRLLAKTVEERYQTATGLESDLRRCLAEWEAHRHVLEFPLGQHDTPDRLLIPEKLYGRASEIETLLAAFARTVTGGGTELVLVSGYSGIGKSSVVNELHKPLVPPRGLFAAGKFDQYKRDVPYATLAQAFQNLLRPILAKSEEELSKWRDALCRALDPNGQLIVELIPELRFIIGEQPPVTELPTQDAQRRFHLVFRRFISVFARREHPLALFLDDLQWLDAATLDLLEDLLTSDFADQGSSEPSNREPLQARRMGVQYLMLIGAYRDNEVDSTHPLIRKLEAIRQAGGKVQEIVLAPLAVKDLERLLADSLHCEPERAAPLAHLIHEKTAGNPFFAIQFLSALAEESLLTYDHGRGRWSWDLNRIHAKGYTDNVVDLLLEKLIRLPAATQNALSELACLGNSVDVDLLEIVHRNSNQDVHGQLWEAIRTGLVFRSETSYTFIHDRVQEAAYYLIPEECRGQAHLRIGRLLAAEIPPEEREERIFEIVNQLNRASHLVTSVKEGVLVAELNLDAGRRAKNSTAYASALKYLAAGRAKLTEASWDQDYELIFSIESLTAECELLTADMPAAESRLSMLAGTAKGAHDSALVTRLRLTLYTALGRSDTGLEICLEYLRRGGVKWSLHPTAQEVRQEYDRIYAQLGSRQIEDLLDLPWITDSDVRDKVEVLTEAVTPAVFVDENLCSLVLCYIVNLSLEHGNSEGSGFAYVWFGILAGMRFGNYQDGFRFGRLGYELTEKRELKRYQARTYMSFGNLVMPYVKHAREGRDLVRRAFDAAYRIGDLTFAAYSWNELITNFLTVGDPLAEVQSEAEKGLEFARRAGFGLIADIITAQVQIIRMLRGLNPEFGCFDDEVFDELRFERHLASNRVFAVSEFWYWTRKVQGRFFAGKYASAADVSLKAQRLLWTSINQLQTAEFRFYGALSHAAFWDRASPEQKPQHFEALIAHHKRLLEWAENCPENFENRAALVGAEIARIEGRDLDAMRLYEQAIRSAQANGFVHNEALANELAGRFYAARGLEKIARVYLQDAHYCYLRWGADGKVRQLEEMYPHLRVEEPALGPTSTIATPVEHLDLATLIKVSQAVSSEIVLEKLINTLMRTAIEQAGAERGLLILPHGGEQRIAAEATTGGDTVQVQPCDGPVTAAVLPESVLNYVLRTRESVILDDAAALPQFATDPYIRQHRVRSILCLPLTKQTKLIGVLYLENNLTSRAFAMARIEVLKIVASQAAISLENSLLFTEQRRLRQLEAELAHTNRVSMMGELAASIAHEIKQPIGAAVTNAEVCMRFLDRNPSDVREAREAALEMARDARRAADIVDRVRSLYGKGSSRQEMVDVNDVIREMTVLLRDEANRHSVTTRTDLGECLPKVMADRVQLRQALMNLMLNGIEAMRDTTGELSVKSQLAEDGQVLISVTDAGVGLPTGKTDQIFNAFFTTKPQGTGLGLAITRSIVESHGGRVWATANSGYGTTFQFTLPQQKGREHDLSG
jgi:predicted ATPase/signal transduction histidine kinase